MSGRTCTRCVMEEDGKISIRFDTEGVCSFCHSWESLHRQVLPESEETRKQLEETAEAIRREGEGRAYDSILGLSGGVDSTYVAHQAKRLGLRPLVVHLDNGWNSELAVANIERVCNGLGFDLHTHVVRWEEFRDLHRAYLLASVVDVEIPTDHAIAALLIGEAARRGVRYVLSGMNVATEGLIPSEWVWDKGDLLNLRAIHRRYGQVPLLTFPQLGFFRNIWYRKIRGIRIIELLDFLPYRKDEAKEVIARDLGWKDYGGKHHESIFTRFYQGHILPRKFGIDKRRAHLSSLICSGEMEREEALIELANPPYNSELLRQDREFVLKKLGFSEAEFEALMAEPPVPHDRFPCYRKRHYRHHQRLAEVARPFTRPLKKILGGGR